MGEDIDADFRKVLGHSMKHGGLGIMYARLSEENVYNTYKAAIGELVGSILGDTTLNYVGYRACIYGASGARVNIESIWRWRIWLDKSILQEAKRGTASIGQRGMVRVLALYPTALTACSYLGRNYGIFFPSDIG